MSLRYGCAKGKIINRPKLKPSRHGSETQYHLHLSILVGGANWDVAINVGTNDSDDLLLYKLVYDFHHPITRTLSDLADGEHDLTGQTQLPALDFLRSDLLAETGRWRPSDPMNGSSTKEPVQSMNELLIKALQEQASVVVFGRFYKEGDGIHDIHMNQGSTGSFLHRAGNDSNDHNDVWQDGAVFVSSGASDWVAYVAAFEQQHVPTDDLGNPGAQALPIDQTGDGKQ